MTSQVANTIGHVQWLSVISTPGKSSQQPFSKNWDPVKPTFFKIWLQVQPPQKK